MWLNNSIIKRNNLRILQQRYFSSINKNNITIYQYKICPFCNRVKSFLDYNQMKYQVIEVNPTTKKEIKFSNHSKVPVLTINDQIIEWS